MVCVFNAGFEILINQTSLIGGSLKTSPVFLMLVLSNLLADYQLCKQGHSHTIVSIINTVFKTLNESFVYSSGCVLSAYFNFETQQD